MDDIYLYKKGSSWYVNHTCGEVVCSSFKSAREAAKIIWETGLSPVSWWEMFHGETGSVG